MMGGLSHSFVAGHYEGRARDYVASAVHAGGDDLDQLEALLRGRNLGRVLDLGCGGGHVSYRASPHVREVVACDVASAMLAAVGATATERGLSNILTRLAAAEDLPFPDSSFDVVLSRFTSHHWQDLQAGLRQACRVLKPGSQAVFIDTVAAAERTLDTHLQAIELLRDVSHVRNYSVAEWVASLAHSGFLVEGLTLRRLRMEFSAWIARTRTPPIHADAIRSLQASAPPNVQRHFAIGDDGSFDLETVTLVVRRILPDIV